MSRSYKKYWGWTDNNLTKKYYKRLANKIVRRKLDIPNGKAYKKVFNSWNIVDYKWIIFSNKEKGKTSYKWKIK